MGQYRVSRNIEGSFIEYLREELASSWSNVNIEKSFVKVYEIKLDPKIKNAIICIRVGITTHDKAELGSNSTIRNPQVLIDLFCASDGQRLDLKDFLINILKVGLPYYEYTISSGVISDKTQNGRIRVLDIDDTPINFDTDRDKLDVHDRYRHLLTLSISLGRVEA